MFVTHILPYSGKKLRSNKKRNEIPHLSLSLYHMKHPIQIHLTRYPHLKMKERKTFLTLHRVDYAKQRHLQHDLFNFSEQEYLGKHAYLNWIEIHARQRIQFQVSVCYENLFWVYQLKGSIRIELAPANTKNKMAIKTLQENQYALFYSSPRAYIFHAEAGHHYLFFYVIHPDWQKHHEDEVPKRFQTFSAALHKKMRRSFSSKSLTIHAAVQKEILQLASLPRQNGLSTDAMIYVPLTRLYSISKKDINGSKEENEDELKIMKGIRFFIKEQVKVGEVPLIPEICNHFKIRIHQLRKIHKKKYGYSLQRFITLERLNTSADMLKNTDLSISEIAYTVGYHLKVFQKQFKHYFKESPSEYRKKQRNSF